MDTLSPDLTRSTRREPAARLRDQADACRRLSSVATTPTGASAMIGVAEDFEQQARKLDLAGSA